MFKQLVISSAETQVLLLILQELEKVGGREELDRMVKEHNLATSPRK